MPKIAEIFLLDIASGLVTQPPIMIKKAAGHRIAETPEGSMKCIDPSTPEGDSYAWFHKDAQLIKTKDGRSLYILCPICYTALSPGSGEVYCQRCGYNKKVHNE